MTTSRIMTPHTALFAASMLAAGIGPAMRAAALSEFVGFQSASPVAVGDAPISLAIDDLNGDGHLDLAVANTAAGAVSIRLGLGGGEFSATREIQVGPFPDAIAVGDVDGDGDVDLVVTSNPSGAENDGVIVMRNDGHATFSYAGFKAVGSSPQSVELVDLNRDQHLDLVVGIFSNVAVMLGDGHGGFGSPDLIAAGNSFLAAQSADVNLDGHPDVIAAGIGAPTIAVLMNQGSGLLNGPIEYDAGDRPRSFAVGDVTGDSWPDIIIAGETQDGVGAIHVLAGAGEGVFEKPQLLPNTGRFGTGIGPWDAALVDLDFDIDLDLVVSNEGSGDVSVYLNDGAGGFSQPSHYPAGASARALVTGDVNNDGAPDLVVATLAADSVALLINLTRDPVDLNSNGVVDSVDLAILLSVWGTDGASTGADLTDDGIVNGDDLAVILANWAS